MVSVLGCEWYVFKGGACRSCIILMLIAWFKAYEEQRAALVARIRVFGYKAMGKLGSRQVSMRNARNENMQDMVGNLVQKARSVELERLRVMLRDKSGCPEKWCQVHATVTARNSSVRTYWASSEQSMTPLYVTDAGLKNPILTCADRLYFVWMGKEEAQRRQEAFLMGTHARLGAESLVYGLDAELVRLVCRFL